MGRKLRRDLDALEYLSNHPARGIALPHAHYRNARDARPGDGREDLDRGHRGAVPSRPDDRRESVSTGRAAVRSHRSTGGTGMTGWIDLQVNGYGGVDFNADEISDDALLEVAGKLKSDGVDKILVTIITAPLQTMLRRISRWADRMERMPSLSGVVAGLHIEGPFINSDAGYVGAHRAADVTQARVGIAEPLVDAGRGNIRMVTLAPECDQNGDVTQWLTERGVRVAAGHSDASVDQLNRCIDRGLVMYTHLGNGCPTSLDRHDNIIQRVLSVSDRIAVSFIADGHHVPFFALRNYLRVVPDENIIIVTDAIAAAGMPPGQYPLGDQIVEVEPDRSAWFSDRSHFAGCATTLSQMAQELSCHLGVSDEQLHRWMVRHPARILGCGE